MVELWSNHKKKQDYIIDIQNIQLDFQKGVEFSFCVNSSLVGGRTRELFFYLLQEYNCTKYTYFP